MLEVDVTSVLSKIYREVIKEIGDIQWECQSRRWNVVRQLKLLLKLIQRSMFMI